MLRVSSLLESYKLEMLASEFRSEIEPSELVPDPGMRLRTETLKSLNLTIPLSTLINAVREGQPNDSRAHCAHYSGILMGPAHSGTLIEPYSGALVGPPNLGQY